MKSIYLFVITFTSTHTSAMDMVINIANLNVSELPTRELPEFTNDPFKNPRNLIKPKPLGPTNVINYYWPIDPLYLGSQVKEINAIDARIDLKADIQIFKLAQLCYKQEYAKALYQLYRLNNFIYQNGWPSQEIKVVYIKKYLRFCNILNSNEKLMSKRNQ